MPNIIHITDLTDPALAPFVSTNEIQLKRWNEPSPEGLFIAESPKVIRRALAAGYSPVSLLCEQKYIDGQAADIIAACKNVPIYTAPTETLTALTGYKLTQGALCAMQRKPLPQADTLLENASRVVVMEDIMNQTNIGAIFRNAAALGFDAVLLTPAASVTPASNHGYSKPLQMLHIHKAMVKIIPPPLSTIRLCELRSFGLSMMLKWSAILK